MDRLIFNSWYIWIKLNIEIMFIQLKRNNWLVDMCLPDCDGEPYCEDGVLNPPPPPPPPPLPNPLPPPPWFGGP